MLKGKSKLQQNMDKVLLHIPNGKFGEIEISRKAMAEATDLTEDQVGFAIASIRDAHPELPLITTSDGYLYTVDSDEVFRYQHKRVKSARTSIRRTWNGTVEPWLKGLDPKIARRVIRAYQRMLEEMEETEDIEMATK